MSSEHHVFLDPRLIESEARYQAVIENASDMIQSVRPDGTFEFVNRAWHTVLGYSDDDLEHMIIWDIIQPETIDHCQLLFMQAMQGQTLERIEVMFVAKDGRIVPTEGSATSRIVDGQVIATHGFFRDISERLQADALRERNEQLERERLAQYLEKMAALGKLSAGLAHELNNPAAAAQRSSDELLGSLGRRDVAAFELIALGLPSTDWQTLGGFLSASGQRSPVRQSDDPLAASAREEALEACLETHGVAEGWRLAAVLAAAGIDDDKVNRLAGQIPDAALEPALRWLSESLAVGDAADVIRRSTSRMTDLVGAIKAYSYMDRAAEQVIDIHEGLDNTRILLAHRLKDMRLIEDYDRDLPPVRAFGSGLNQVWTNIIDNAIDATGGRGQLTVRTRRDGDNAVVEIEDNGPGIPPEQLSCIFEPFFTTKPQGTGLGLGLDTVWRIITDGHHGTIEVVSAPGRTVFHVTVPFAPGHDA